MHDHTILSLVDHIYAAVEDPGLWPVFLDEFARTCQAEVGTLYFQDLNSHAGTTEFFRGMDESYNSSYRAYYAARNIYLTLSCSE